MMRKNITADFPNVLKLPEARMVNAMDTGGSLPYQLQLFFQESIYKNFLRFIFLILWALVIYCQSIPDYHLK